MAAVEPLPLVPAMRMEGEGVLQGLPRAAVRARMWARSNLRRGDGGVGRQAEGHVRRDVSTAAA